ncbi:uncharacterized protein K441DRAFT_623504 [Cenococcum geophilum 1.58]|uniref:Uncharacterized protein n=1 Tax=Cenococcum geophilum 1.58 TaxID=794803 RepID=A0ACC8ELW2_9PEZI|nr:hypothetical protein K441DRAFT_623504 [Cenococcum geophilum 1.58]
MASIETPKPGVQFFHVATTRLDGSGPDLEDVNGASCRQRRRHAKSKRGCTGCKRRRIKCDESLPACRNCVKKGVQCSFLDNPASESRNSSRLELQRPLSQADFCDSLSPDVNMFQMKLFHHFGTTTANTLVFGVSIWRDKIMALSFQHDFLMHAILLVSATHLSYLNPVNIINYRASVQHLSKTLHLFRHALSQPVTSHNADALMATAVLLYHHAWANIELIQSSSSGESDSDVPLDLSMDPIFTLSSGLRGVFLSAWKYLSNPSSSVFAASTLYRPRYSITRAANKSSKMPEVFVTLLERYFNRIQDPLGTSVSPTEGFSKRSLIETIIHTPDLVTEKSWLSILNQYQLINEATDDDKAVFKAYMDAASRLAPLLSLCRPQQQPCWFTEPIEGTVMEFGKAYLSTQGASIHATTHDLLLPDIARYIFSFPVRALPTFTSLARKNDSRAYMVLLYFYRGVRSLLPKQAYWWSRPRADYMEKAIHNTLEARGYGALIQSEEYALETSADDLQERLVD